MPYGYARPLGWAKLRAAILERDDHRCYICGGGATEVDALIPESQGGSHADSDNLAAICTHCHGPKSERERRAGYASRKPRASTKRLAEQHPSVKATK